ncbi:glycoside hydrolase [Aspergillus heterothallicus]
MASPDAESLTTLLSQLTLTEKCALLAGKNMWETTPIPRLGIQSLKTTDGPAGVRGAKWTDGSRTTFIPCGISLAATFDKQLVQRIGAVLGAEARNKQAHVLLAPTMNLSRSPFGGRNFENFGEDPFLTGVLASAYISGVQSQGVGACMKHFVANDQETRRFNMDETIDERTLREVYLRPFQMALAADPWTAMTSYPKINGVHADCSRALVRGILREEWGYQGLAMSDWGGLNSTVESIKASTDLEMPGPALRYGPALEQAVKAGHVSEEDDINPSVRRIVKTLHRAGCLAAGRGSKSEAKDINVMEGEETKNCPEYRDTAREAAEDGIVLLRNEGHTLPLQPANLTKIAIIGPNAKTPTAGGSGSAIVNPYYVTNPYDSIVEAAKRINPSLEVVYEQGILTHLHLPLLGSILTTPDGTAQGVQVDFYHGHALEGNVVATTYWQDSLVYLMSDGDIPSQLKGGPFSFRARGIFTPTTSGYYDFSLSNTGKAKFFVDDELLIDNTEWTQICANFMNCSSPDKTATMYLSAGRAYAFRIDNVAVPPPTRPHDNTLFHRIAGVRVGMLIQHEEEAMFAAAVETAKTADVAVIITGHNNDTEREGCDRTSLSLPRRTDELIRAVASTNANTVVVTQSACAVSMPWVNQVPAIIQAWYQGQENGNALARVLLGSVNPSGKLPITFPRRIEDHGSHLWFPGNAQTDKAEYGEGVMVGYRWFDAKGLEPLWPFGFGLSYTTFTVSDVRVYGSVAADGSRAARLYALVTNTGSCVGKEVVQVYVSSSNVVPEGQRVPKGLAGFEKVMVAPGEGKEIEITLDSTAFSWYDVEIPGWRVDSGVYKCFVGNSSRDIYATVDIVVQ